MKFSSEKKRSIIMYLLEQIDAGAPDVSRLVSEKCNISRNTVNNYLSELIDGGIIRKLKRNQYELVNEKFVYIFYRNRAELESDTYIFDNFFKAHIEDCTDEAKQIWSHAITEMVNNVIDHSNAEQLSMLVKKNYFKISVALLDNGVGIFEKLKEHFGFASLDEARQELFKGKLTTDAENHSGEGIFFTSKMMDTFFIMSSGLTFARDKYDADVISGTESASNGTAVVMTLSNFTHRKIADVFDEFSGVESGFTKTVIPMRSMFDNSPVSRSQAKRVCNRLESFKEIILDFDEIEWMGQAFAHQLFVVFQNKNPEINLVPINMSEAVEKMYNHVKNTK